MINGSVWSGLRAALVATTVALGLTVFPGTAQAAGIQDVSVRLVQSWELPVTGRSTTILGDMVSGRDVLPDREVSVAITPAGEHSQPTVIFATTDRQGRFEVRYRPRSTFTYTASFAGDEFYAAAQSSARQRVAARVRLVRVPKTVRAGRTFTVQGRGPALLAGATVIIHRGVRGVICGVGRPPSDGVLATTRLRDDGSFRVRMGLSRSGKQPIFAQITKTSTTAAGYTTYRAISVRSAR